MGTRISDSALAGQIISALHQNTQLDDSDIQISVDEGWVSLDGKVGQEADRLLVQSCMENIPGVSGVTNNLTFSRLYPKCKAG